MVDIAHKAFGAAQELLRECRVQLNAVVAADHLDNDEMKDHYLEREGIALAHQINRLYRTIVMIHEALGQSNSLAEFTAAFEPLRPSLSQISYFDDDPDMPESNGIDFLAEQIRTIAPLIVPPKAIDVQRQILWTILEQTNVLLNNLEILPTKEKHIQDALEKVLMLPFPDTICHQPTTKQTKAYHPDFTVQSLDTAIELKFVGKSADVGKTLGALYEDMHAYADSQTWSKVYGVIYMTGPFLSQKRLDAELKKAKAPANWRVCVVVGKHGFTEETPKEHGAKKSAK